MTSPLCYCCSAPATSREHVPPRCLFPVAADAIDATDYRLQLITVPSCDLHNAAKSHDDEYLLCVIALGILGNPIGQQQAVTKVLRALSQSPGLTKAVLGTAQQVTVQDITTGIAQPTLAFKVTMSRVEAALEHIARGLHFHHFGEKWSGPVQVAAEFLVSLGSPNAEQINNQLESARKTADAHFRNVPRHGRNQSVFYYQIIEEPPLRGIRMCFYEGTKAMAVFEAAPTEQNDA